MTLNHVQNWSCEYVPFVSIRILNYITSVDLSAGSVAKLAITIGTIIVNDNSLKSLELKRIQTGELHFYIHIWRR